MSRAHPTESSDAGARRWQSLARAAARGRARHGEESPLRELLAFELDGAGYAVPIERVREIVRMRPITPVPRVPEAILGVISLRGAIIQVLDLRRRLGLPPAETSRRTRIVVLHGEDRQVTGLLVDAVSEVLRVTDDQIRSAPTGEAGVIEALCARGREFVSLLELARVLRVDGSH